MRKLLIYSILSISLLACKKNDEKVAGTEAKDSLTDNSLSLDTSNSDGKLISLKELSPEKITEVLKSNHSDTLYVTNFFATWCGPCMQEIPHFRKKMDELKNQPVKFTFVSLDNKTDWDTKVIDFADEYEINQNVILLDGMLLKQEFFTQNFQSWNGEAIPFTLIRKGDKSDETVGSMTEEMLNQKINKLLADNSSAKAIDNKEKTMISSQKKSLK
ncbi:TlpA family protein disulfide reductase [Epilithonimonas sp.]|uniref:TlpA family protein disulfide reductase n=1 Tax=Epilithonimonas sp. TaxID=2894511 RepID=UPI0035AEF6E3